MAFSIPAHVTAFWAKYPFALPVFSDEDDNTYLNHYESKALIDAKKNGKKLYKLTKPSTVLRVYPASFLYEMTYDTREGAPSGGYDIVEATANGFTEAVAGQSIAEIAAAFDAVLVAASVLANPTEVYEIIPLVFKIRVITSDEDLELGLVDDNGSPFEATQIFL